jgi:Metal-dependent amidase/aminoacylase/carboxypeptidase
MLHGMLGRHHHLVLSAIIKDGGTAPNIIPGRAEIWADARSEDEHFLSEIEDRMINIAKSSADMHNCTLEYNQLIPKLSPRKPDAYLDEIYFRNGIKYLGDRLKPPEKAYRDMPRASSDVGNVSQVIPTVHLGIKVGPKGMPGHSEEMKKICFHE